MLNRAISFEAIRSIFLMIPPMKLLLPLALLTAGCFSNPTKEVPDPDAGYTTTYTLDKKDGVYDGPYVKSDTTGKILEKGWMKAGKPHGIRELYYPDGHVKVRERYSHGEMDDLYEYFHPNGKVELTGYYIRGEMYGLWKKFDPDGNLLEEVTMIRNEEYGPFKEYHPNGKLQAEGAYLHGPNEDGTLKLYDETGTLYKTMLCHAGRCFTTWQKG